MKALVLSFLMVMSFALPMSAQRSDDFFRVDEDQYDNRVEGVIWGSIVTQDPTEPAPLGSGLLIMVAAGAGYAVARRKRSIRRGTTLLLAVALLLGMTQCKKNVETIKTVEGGIPMTLEAYNGSKTSFDGSGAISWGTNEVIYVVYNGSCIGSVTNGAGGGTTFTGTVTGLESGNEYTLHYYYVGTEQTIAENATSFSMDFINQDGSLANLGKFHIGHGTQTLTYEGGTITSVAGLRSLVSVGYFDIAGMAEVGEKVYMYGDNLNNKISINFSTNAVTNTKVTGNNLICLGAVTEGATCGKYVMLVPNHIDGTETLTTDITFISKRTTGTCNSTFNYGIVADRFYCKDGNTSTPIDVAEYTYQAGNLRGEFKMNASGDKLHFSQGNLQYLGNANGTGTWRFADYQYSFMGDGPSSGTNYQGNVTVTGYTKYNASADLDVARDLFGWGTSGYNDKSPNMTTTNSNNYYSGSMVDEGANYDWGVYHSASGSSTEKITNGGNYAWRLWTSAEMSYVMNRENKVYTSPDYCGMNKKLYCVATLSGITTNNLKGVIVFPDGWNGSYIRTIKYAGEGSYGDNVFNATQWAMMEALGCVFLPVAHVRDGSVIKYLNEGHYWSSSAIYTVGEYRGGTLEFTSSSSVISSVSNCCVRKLGQSVRLIRNVD